MKENVALLLYHVVRWYDLYNYAFSQYSDARDYSMVVSCGDTSIINKMILYSTLQIVTHVCVMLHQCEFHNFWYTEKQFK